MENIMIEKLINIKNSLESSRNAVKSLYKENYDSTIQTWIDKLKKAAIDLDCTELQAYVELDKLGLIPPDSMTQLMFTAALCEIMQYNK